MALYAPDGPIPPLILSDNISPNSTLSHYRVISKLGAGGMGEVFLAEDARLGRKVALKVLAESTSVDRGQLMRFQREAHSASALNHPNILTVHEFGEENGVHFLASEFVQGKTLRAMIDEASLPLSDVLDITIQIATALQAAHEAGIVHRDIKPENVMIRDDGYVKVLDFGIAKLSKHASAKTGNSGPEAPTRIELQTQAGMVMGTAAYMSPEQARGKEVDSRSDIFSLGVVLYEVLARRLPFTGETINHTIVAILEQDPQPISGLRIPVELQRITLRALEKRVSERYQSAADLIVDLKGLRKRLEFESELGRTSPLDNPMDVPTQRLRAAVSEPIDPDNTIAVLPFENMSSNEDADYFSDGLAEELLNVLSKIRGLRVAARTSAFSFKGKQKTIAEIGHILNVASVLEGSVRMVGNRVRISVQLSKVKDGYHLWSETYNRTMDDIFEVQDDIAQSVVKELRATLLGEDVAPNITVQVKAEVAEAVKGRTENPEAQRLYLQGRHLLDRFNADDTEKGIEYLKLALDLDPKFALGWAELGRGYGLEADLGLARAADCHDRARRATEQALSLDPELAEGHVRMGWIQMLYDWDWQSAKVSFNRARELEPENVKVLQGLGALAYKTGHLEEALELSGRVIEQDPLNAPMFHNFGFGLHAADRFVEAQVVFEKALELAPQRYCTRAFLSLTLLAQGRQEQALAESMREPYAVYRLYAQAIIYHVLGRCSDSDEALGELIEKHSERWAYQIAEVHGVRGEVDAAFEWLERAYRQRDSGVTQSKVSSHLRTLHDDQRWATLMNKLGFEG